MNKFLETLKTIWSELEPVIELFIYIGIAYLLSSLLGITRLQAIGVVFAYFLLSIIRVYIEKSR